MVTKHLKFPEIQRFGTEYLSIQQYIKNFMSSIMKRVAVYIKKLECDKKQADKENTDIEKRIEYINIQTKSLYEKLLN